MIIICMYVCDLDKVENCKSIVKKILLNYILYMGITQMLKNFEPIMLNVKI